MLRVQPRVVADDVLTHRTGRGHLRPCRHATRAPSSILARTLRPAGAHLPAFLKLSTKLSTLSPPSARSSSIVAIVSSTQLRGKADEGTLPPSMTSKTWLVKTPDAGELGPLMKSSNSATVIGALLSHTQMTESSSV